MTAPTKTTAKAAKAPPAGRVWRRFGNARITASNAAIDLKPSSEPMRYQTVDEDSLFEDWKARNAEEYATLEESRGRAIAIDKELISLRDEAASIENGTTTDAKHLGEILESIDDYEKQQITNHRIASAAYRSCRRLWSDRFAEACRQETTEALDTVRAATEELDEIIAEHVGPILERIASARKRREYASTRQVDYANSTAIPHLGPPPSQPQASEAASQQFTNAYQIAGQGDLQPPA